MTEEIPLRDESSIPPPTVADSFESMTLTMHCRRKQTIYVCNNDSWTPVTQDSMATAPLSRKDQVTSLRVLTWNVDAFAPAAGRRLNALLDHVSTQIDTDPLGALDIVCLQEVSPLALRTLTDHPWIKANFFLTDISPTDWRGFGTFKSFGSVSLVRKAVGSSTPLYVPTEVYRTDYKSRMNRDALIVDLTFPSIASGSQDAGDVAILETHPSVDRAFHLRVINVHLESLALQPPLRPAQLAHCTNHVNEADAGFIAGDFNAIEYFDDELAEKNGLIDAWAALHPAESGDEVPEGIFRLGMKKGGET